MLITYKPIERKMNSFIYHSKNIRCRVKYIEYMGHFELQIQERRFLVLWISVHKWMTVKEGFWGESDQHPILRISCQFGNNAEAFKTGTLDIKSRVKSFFDEYFQVKKRDAENHEKIKNLS